MAYGRPRDKQREEQWRRWVGKWRSSGLSVHEFCQHHGLSARRFFSWRRRLAERDGQRPAFVPVHVIPDPKAAADGSSSGLELVVGGRRLRIGPGFDAPTLQRLLVVLEEGAS